MRHNAWLDWKIRHGLAPRGDSSAFVSPVTFVGRVYKALTGKLDHTPKIFQKKLEGRVGPNGDVQ